MRKITYGRNKNDAKGYTKRAKWLVRVIGYWLGGKAKQGVEKVPYFGLLLSDKGLSVSDVNLGWGWAQQKNDGVRGVGQK